MSTTPTDWGERNAFVSPTTAAKVRLGNRGGGGRKSPGVVDSASLSRRRSTSIVQSPEDAEIFQQLSGSTAVSLTRSSRHSGDDQNTDVITQLSDGAMRLMHSCSPTSSQQQQHYNAGYYDDDTVEDDCYQHQSPAPTDLDLGHNDNSFHVLASLLVEFFQDRITSGSTTLLVLLPEDRYALDRLLPSTAVQPFITAVQYRLGHTPAVPTTPLQFLALECQKLRLDSENSRVNPILMAATRLQDTPITMDVGLLEEEDDYVIDVHAHASSSSSSSSQQSGIKVASSADVQEEMRRQATEGHAIFDRVDRREVVHLHDGDAMMEEEQVVMDLVSNESLVNHPSTTAVADEQSRMAVDVADLPTQKREEEIVTAFPTDNNNKNVGEHTKSHREKEEGTIMESNIETEVTAPKPIEQPITELEQTDQPGKQSESVRVASEPENPSLVTVPPSLPPNQDPTVARAVERPQQPEKSTIDHDAFSSSVQMMQTSASAFFSDIARSVHSTFQANETTESKTVTTADDNNRTVHTSGATRPTESEAQQPDSDNNDTNGATRPTQSSVVPPESCLPQHDPVKDGMAEKPAVDTEANPQEQPAISSPVRPMNPFLFNFASFMDKRAAPPPPRPLVARAPVAQAAYAPPVTKAAYAPPASLTASGPMVAQAPYVPPTVVSTSQAPPSPLKGPVVTHETAAAKVDHDGVELPVLTRKQSTKTELTERDQLVDELQEAEQMLGMSITPETTSFWRNHRDALAVRLETIDGVEDKQTVTRIHQVHSSNSAPNIGDSMRALPDTINTTNGTNGSKAFSEVTPTPAIDANGSLQPNLILSSGTGSTKDALPMVDVVAPADLPAGYQFEAEIEGKRFLAVVPSGGVQQGETFTCYMKDLDSVAVDIPIGYWKDSQYDLCKFGCCHPVAWHSIFCPLIALGQIQTRINLDFLGRPRFGTGTVTNRFMMLSMVMFWCITNTALFVACNLKWSHGLELSVADICAFFLMNGTMVGFIVFVTQSTRNSLREKFMIREERCFDLEDLVCSLACLPCTVGQMARHTANFEEYESVCCSHTGLPDGVRVGDQDPKEPTVPFAQDGYVV